MAPQLRGMVQSNLKMSVARAVVLGVIGGFAYKYFVAMPRRQKYEDYYKYFDAEKEAKKMELAEMSDPQFTVRPAFAD